MIVVDLFLRPAPAADKPEMDALRQQDALFEAALMEVRVDVGKWEVGLLFDLRGAIHLRGGNTAILIVRDVQALSGTREYARRGGGPRWNYVMASHPSTDEDAFRFAVETEPSAGIVVTGRSAEFYVGDIPGNDAAPPDFVQDDPETIARGLPRWDAEFTLLQASAWAPTRAAP